MWTSRGGGASLRGEVGILKYVYSSASISDKCYLIIEHDSRAYVGCLMFSDEAFGIAILNLLRSHLGRPITEVGSLDISFTL